MLAQIYQIVKAEGEAGGVRKCKKGSNDEEHVRMHQDVDEDNGSKFLTNSGGTEEDCGEDDDNMESTLMYDDNSDGGYEDNEIGEDGYMVDSEPESAWKRSEGKL